MSKTLTIFTPTYNRADFLRRSFDALQKQSCKDFLWLIVDDGSTDHTVSVVNELQLQACDFEIKYVYQTNGGLHTGYNTAIELANTELCMCIDSDDYIAECAVERIVSMWKKIKRSDCAGIVALDAYPTGELICTIQGSGYINLNAYDTSHKWSGDRKLIVRTSLYKAAAPMPSFLGEKNFNPQYLHYKIAQDYTFYVMNQAVCIVDYQETGMSANIFRQYLNSPNSFAEYRRMQMTMKPNRWIYQMKSAIHYDSSCIIAGNPQDIIKKSPMKLLTALMTPVGLLLTAYIRFKARKG